MSRSLGLNVAVLAASIALAMASTAANAATVPDATQLPANGSISAGMVTAGAATNGVQNIDIGGNAVINWGSGTEINAGGVGGFNIGSAAALTFSGSSGSAVLNVDSSGNASQIFGSLVANGPNVYVANENGVIVGASAQVSGAGNVSLIANTLSPSAVADFAADPTSLAYTGTGGDVTVAQGSTISNTVLVSGGGTVNVNLNAFTGGGATLAAGVPSANAGLFGTANANAALNITGQLMGGSLAGFSSAGTASNVGVLDLSGLGSYSVAGTLSNTGLLTLPAMNGAVSNGGQLTTSVAASFTGLTNDGQYNANGITVLGGSLVNNQTITGAGNVVVTDGSLVNNGVLAGVASIATTSDANRTAGADYSITNSSTGTIVGTGSLVVDANRSTRDTPDQNDTTGSFITAGNLQLAPAGGLTAKARNDITLGGSILTTSGGVATAVSAANPLGSLVLSSGGYDATVATPAFYTNGILTISTPVAVSRATLHGRQVKLMSDVSSVAAGVPSGAINILAGAAVDDYSIRVASGVTVSGGSIALTGSSKSLQPNVILQGVLSADTLDVGTAALPVGDVFSGGAGGLVATGATPTVTIAFAGRVKTAPYLNDANFRYNYLPITATGGTLGLTLKPIYYNTNGTSNGLSAVNVLVDGSVSVTPPIYLSSPAIFGAGTASGPTTIPNTHLVLQAAGDIATTGDYYWPGYVYLGTIGRNTDGSVAPGTLGSGTITLGGNFSNTLPGSVDSGGGIHFITQNALNMGSYSVTTNANSWINFGTDALTQGYASGSFSGAFFGGTQGSGTVVNYGALDPSLFHTHPPVASR